MTLTTFEIAQLLLQFGGPAAIEIIDIFNGEDPDWLAIRERVNQSFESLVGNRPETPNG